MRLSISGFMGVMLLGFAFVAPAHADDPIQLKVMSFNVWYGGEQVNFDKVVEAVRKADPDILAVLEPDGNLAKIAKETGLVYYDRRRNFVSKYPIYDPEAGERTDEGDSTYGTTALNKGSLHAWVMVRPGKVVAMANTHLSSDAYGPDEFLAGKSVEEQTKAEEDNRVEDATLLAKLGQVAADGTPVFLTGDFNTPSHLDWTAANQAARPNEVKFAFAWPVTKILQDAGLRDSYREVFPDSVAKPGFTWTPGMPNPYLPDGTVPDRIDFVFTAGNSKTIASQIVGEENGPDVDISVSPYPSDHRAVVSTFEVVPADASALIAVEPQRVEAGTSFMVRSYLPASATYSTLVVPRGGAISGALTGITDENTSYRTGIRLSSLGLDPAEYDALLINGDGDEVKRTRFTVVPAEAKPSVEVKTEGVKADDTIHVAWSSSPGNRYDWIAVFKAGDPSTMNYLAYRYTDAHINGGGDIALGGEEGGISPGKYFVRLLADDSYTVLAETQLEIAGP